VNIDSLKELLLRKTSDINLQTLIEYSSDELLTAHVLESLEKMAQHRAGASTTKANQLVHQFANMLDPQDIDHMRDAMGHHAARFGAAMKTGDKAVANKHAKQWVKLNDLARKIESGTGTNIGWHMPVDIKAWQANAEKPEGHKSIDAANPKSKSHYYDRSKDRIDLPGLQYHENKKPPNNDYTHLGEAPAPHKAGSNSQQQYIKEMLDSKHEGPEGEERYHNGPYPMEHVKLGGKYPDITGQDVSELGTAKDDHAFDKHPIMSYFAHKEGDLGEDQLKDYGDKLLAYEEAKQHPDLQTKFGSMADEKHGARPQFDAVHGPSDKKFDLTPHLPKKEEK
jgi:hypothetical protein